MTTLTVTSLKEDGVHELEFDGWINQTEPERFREGLWPEPQHRIRYRIDRLTRALRASGSVFLCADGKDRLGVMALEPLKWEREYLKIECGRIAACYIKQGLDDGTRYDVHDKLLKKALAWAGEKKNKIRLLQRRLLSSRKEEIRCLEKAGFSEADHMVTFLAELRNMAQSGETEGRFVFRTAQPDDEQDLLAMTRGAFPHSRFVTDPKLKARGEEVYQSWIKNLLHNRPSDKTPTDGDTTVLVCRIGEKTVGYAAYRIDWSFADPQGHLGMLELIVVDPAHRRQGIGRALLNRVLDEMRRQRLGENKNRIRYVEATTWTAQQDAVALYQRAGLQEKETLLTYHLWRN